jgi:hypothetical protein
MSNDGSKVVRVEMDGLNEISMGEAWEFFSAVGAKYISTNWVEGHGFIIEAFFRMEVV